MGRTFILLTVTVLAIGCRATPRCADTIAVAHATTGCLPGEMSCGEISNSAALGANCSFVDVATDSNLNCAEGRAKYLFERMSPVFRIYDYNESHNRIGTPTVSLDSDGDEVITVSPDKPTVYLQETWFTTNNGKYTNLIYRIHFEKIPFGLIPFHLTWGKNVGLFVIVTVNERDEPVLVTTVHTCGCYAKSIPTTYLSPNAFPDDWPSDKVESFGEELPALLCYEGCANPRLLVTIRPDVHRVMDLAVVDESTLAPSIIAETKDIASLRQLRVGNYTTSFYHNDGCMKGHVKGSVKPWETMLMSKLSCDLFVGSDKDYGPYEETGSRFFTSLKVWHRKDSDMWYFGRFLQYWGWKL